MKLSLGIDFGTESARVVLVDLATGTIVANAVATYAHGVIDARLPNHDAALPPEYALQDPDDWRVALTSAVHEAMERAEVEAKNIVGVGVDFTSCTILPTNHEGTPLCESTEMRTRHHAWPKLWKHHAAQLQADRINAIAVARGEPWLQRYGGKISSEWVMPKALQILEEDAECYAAADCVVEGGDWIVWELTGTLVRNACAAGYKGTWHKVDGWPSTEFLSMVHPQLSELFTKKFSGPIVAPGTCVGGLTDAWAQRLGLSRGTPVAAAIIDAHAACLGGGVASAGIMYMITGTSTCHMLMGEEEVEVKGISGVVADGIVAGLFGYEAGQSSAGDMIRWYVAQGVPPEYHLEAEKRKISVYDLLSERASKLEPGESGLVALDWWNGCRSTLVDAELSGMIVGLNLATRPEEIFRALIEATAFGTRVIIEAFINQGIPVHSLVAGGGLTRSNLIMQIYADVTGKEIGVGGGSEASSIGAAVIGAVAAGSKLGGFDSVIDACNVIAAKPSKLFIPNKLHYDVYDALYREYIRLYQYFGVHENGVMHRMRALRKEVLHRQSFATV